MKFTLRKSMLGSLGLLGASALALGACGDSDDASDEVVAEDVEIVADDALTDVDEEPVEDESLATPEPMPAPAPTETSSFEERQAAEREKMSDDAEAAEKAAADIKAELENMNSGN